MGLSDYDRANVGAILNGHGTWFTARLLRALEDLLAHADTENRNRLAAAFPEEVGLVLNHYEAKSTRSLVGRLTEEAITALEDEVGKRHLTGKQTNSLLERAYERSATYGSTTIREADVREAARSLVSKDAAEES